MIPPAPRSTLFPYTTLFRSQGVEIGPDLSAAGKQRTREELLESLLDPSRRVEAKYQAYLDRKSTRLNSSHGYISYAVFCLKKKSARRPCPPRPGTSPPTSAS